MIPRFLRMTFAAMLLAGTLTAQAQDKPSPKLIKWGWDEPSTIDLRKNIAKMEEAPFDGVVLTTIGWENPRRIDLYKQFWGKEAFTQTQFKDAVHDLKTIPFKRFTDNFMRLNVTPGDVDWFDDAAWEAIVKNGELAAWICKEGNLKGIMFDTEQYQKKLFYYAEWPYRGKRTFDEYSDQARKRGKELAQAMAAIKPDIIYMFTFGTSVFEVKNTWLGGQPPPTYSEYGLLPPFIDGMMDGANAKTSFVDGLEVAYTAKNKARFEELKKSVQASGKHTDNRRRYESKMSTAFGLWMDCGSSTNGWDPVNTKKNFFQPDEFQNVLESALRTTDKYVWLYVEKINWWKNIGLSQPYIDAVKNAREKLGMP